MKEIAKKKKVFLDRDQIILEYYWSNKIHPKNLKNKEKKRKEKDELMVKRVWKKCRDKYFNHGVNAARPLITPEVRVLIASVALGHYFNIRRAQSIERAKD
jgi:hypothetical protein